MAKLENTKQAPLLMSAATTVWMRSRRDRGQVWASTAANGAVKRWRLSLAADHLADPDLTIGRIASLVGYQSPFTFSAAFKAHFGVSPSHYRAHIGE